MAIAICIIIVAVLALTIVYSCIVAASYASRREEQREMEAANEEKQTVSQ